MPRDKTKRQTRLEFSPLPPSSPATASYPKQIRDRAATVGYQGAPRGSKRRKIVDFADVDGQGSSGTSRNDQGSASLKKSSRAARMAVDSDSDASLPDLPLPSSKRITNTSSSQLLASNSSPLSELHSSQVPISSSNNFFRHQGQKSKLRQSSDRKTRSRPRDSSESEDEILPASSLPKASDNFVDLGSDEESSEESDVPRSSIKKRLANGSSPITPRSVTALDDVEEDSEDAPKSSKRRLKSRQSARKPNVVELSSDAESTDSPAPSRKGGNKLTVEEQQEIDDDLKDLESSSDDEPPQSSRSQRAKTERELALERLKRRRAGLSDKAPQQDHASSDASEADSDSDDLPEALLPGTSARDMFAADDDDEGFLTDGGDDTLGEPASIPLEFTRFASSKPKELFKFAIEWMVQKKLNPGFNRQDEIYGLTFAKLDDEVKGLAGSKFESSAWRPEFLFALRARPQIAASKMSHHDREMQLMGKCDACNRSGHTPTYELQFQGKPYHTETLEQVENDAESEDDEPQEDRDASGRTIPSEAHSFFVGRFCMANAETAHALQHWRYHLYEWVVDFLDNSGYNTPEKIVRRDRWGEPKRRKFANKVLDQMVESGEVKKLYKDFRQEVENAREAKQYQRGSSP